MGQTDILAYAFVYITDSVTNNMNVMVSKVTMGPNPSVYTYQGLASTFYYPNLVLNSEFSTLLHLNSTLQVVSLITS